MKRILTITAVMLAFAVLTGGHCHPGPTPVEPSDTASCADACKKLQDLGCPEGDPLPDGTTCTKFCEATQKQGHALNPSCVMTITTCAEVNSKCNKPQ